MKRRLKRIVSTLLVLCMVLSLLPAQAMAAVFSDVQESWAQPSIERMQTLGVVSGNHGKYRPNDPITRAEVATIYANLMGYRTETTNTFSDLSPDAWYYSAMRKANAAGIFSGDGNSRMNPTENISRQEFFVTLARVLGLDDVSGGSSFTDNGDIAAWALPKLNALVKADLLKGVSNNDLTYRADPGRNITRAEVAVMIDRAFPGIFQTADTDQTTVSGNAVITKPDITLSGMSVSGNLILAEGIADGNATLDAVNIPAKTIIRGGGRDSVIFNGKSVFGEIIVSKNAGEAPVSLKFNGNGTAKKLTVQEGSAQTNIFVGGDARIDAIYVNNAGTSITGSGSVPAIYINANDSTVDLLNTRLVVARGVTGTQVNGKAVTGGTTATVDAKGDIKTEDHTESPGGGSGGGGSQPDTPSGGGSLTITFDTAGHGVIAPWTMLNPGDTLTKYGPLPNITSVTGGGQAKSEPGPDGKDSVSTPPVMAELEVFVGWYLGENPVDPTMVLSQSITLTAKFEAVEDLEGQQADDTFTFEAKQPKDLAIKISADEEGTAADNIKIECLSGPDPATPSVSGTGETLTVTAAEGFVPGASYRMTLSDGVKFIHPETNEVMDARIRHCEFTIAREISNDFNFNPRLKSISSAEAVSTTPAPAGARAMGTPLAINQQTGETGANKTTGTFTYTAGVLIVGDVVCINAKGELPTENDLLDTETSYVKITAVRGDEYTWETAEFEDVLFLPEGLSINTANDQDANENTVTVAPENIINSADITNPDDAPAAIADIGDFVVLYSGTAGDDVQ